MPRVTGTRAQPPAPATSASRGERVASGEAPTTSSPTPQAAPAPSPWVAGGSPGAPTPREHASPAGPSTSRVTGGEASPATSPSRGEVREHKGLFRSFFDRLFGRQ